MSKLYKVITTKDLSEAAFYCCFHIFPKYNFDKTTIDTTFTFKVPFWIRLYKKYIGLVNHKAVFAWRTNIKSNTRAHFGLPPRYSGNKKGFKLGNLAVVREDKRFSAKYNNE